MDVLSSYPGQPRRAKIQGLKCPFKTPKCIPTRLFATLPATKDESRKQQTSHTPPRPRGINDIFVLPRCYAASFRSAHLLLEYLTHEDGIRRLCRNVGNTPEHGKYQI